MGALSILTCDAAASAGIPWPDVYFSPAYARVVQHSDRAPWYVALWDPGPIVMPFLLRPIPLPPTVRSAEPAYDVTSPYGYSGCWSPREVSLGEWHTFRTAFRAEMKQRGVVAEFLRLGSLVNGRDALLRADPALNATRHNDTIAVDTSQGVESYWDGCEGRARTAVRKAQRLGYVATSREVQAEDLEPGSIFREMYENTMRRVGAQPYYFFDDVYYTTLHESLAPHLRWFIAERPDRQPAVMALTMVWPPLLHLHLVGSDPASMRDGAGNLCYDAMLRWACDQPEIHRCHLGGGLAANDALFNFKKSFGGERLPYWVASSILDVHRYRELVRARAAQVGCGAHVLESCHYFPSYRVPEAVVQHVLERRAA